MKKFIIISAIALLIYGCRTQNNSLSLRYSIQVGLNKGGIVDNTNVDEISGATIDAFTGATKTGFNVGTRVALPVTRLFGIEAGLDYMLNHQVFVYDDKTNQFIGQRSLNTNQIMLPTTLNFNLLKDGLLQLKVGHLAQYNIVSVNSQGELPSWSYFRWSNGMVMGLTIQPVRLSNGARPGIFTEMYRGSQIYKDFYNQEHMEMPGSSFIKFGIVYNF